MKNIGLLLGMMRTIIPVLFISSLILTSCEKFSFDLPKADPGKTYSFQTDIQPIFTSKCIVCHGSGKNQPTLDAGSAYNSLTTGGYISSDPVNSPETSILYKQITTGSGHTSILNDLQKQSILEWIRQGALNN
jgi:hypothetical protein